MVTWQRIDDDTAKNNWDAWLSGFPDAAFFQSLSWGDYRARFGWTPHRFFVGTPSSPRTLFQALVKRAPLGVGVIWSPGGPVGDLSLCGEGLRRTLKRELGIKQLYVRFRPHAAKSARDEALLQSLGWQRPKHPLGSGKTMMYDLTPEPAELEKSLTKNWRHNLSRAQRSGLTFKEWRDPNPADIAALYANMQEYKGINAQFSPEELTHVLGTLSDKLLLMEALTPDGERVGCRGCLISGTHGFDFLAAASESGRKLYASYGLFWELIRASRERGVRRYDMMGIDPEQNPGVYNFKKGTGAAHWDYLGEWEWCDSFLLKIALDWKLRKTLGGM